MFIVIPMLLIKSYLCVLANADQVIQICLAVVPFCIAMLNENKNKRCA